MTEKFVNLKNNYIQINRWANPEATICDLGCLLLAMENSTDETLVCPIDRITSDLQKTDYLSKLNVSLETKEFLFSTISEYA